MWRIFDFLRSDDLPPMTRANYFRELRYFALWMLVVGTIEGNIAAIVVKKTFAASDWLTTIVWQAPIFMMGLNVLWGTAIRGRRRLPLFILLTGCAAALIGSVALVNPDWRPWGGWVFAAQICLAHLFVTGLVTVQASAWQLNYPTSHRGRIVGRLQTVRFLLVPLSSAAVATLFDWNPEYFRFVYPSAALLGLLSLLPLRRFRVRGESRQRRELSARLRAAGHGAHSFGRLAGGLVEAARILRDDRRFRRYMLAQFTLGAANFFTDPVLVTVLTGQLLLGYFSSNLIMQVIPGVVVWFSIRFWAGYFDRVGVLRYRVVNSAVWMAAYACVAAAMLLVGSEGRGWLWLALPLLVAARLLKGAAHGGGTIAWNIGHLAFARPDQVDLYMSIHVALTGLRALVMPHLGLLANRLLGNGSFVLAVAIALAALLMFRRLVREQVEQRGTWPTAAGEGVGGGRMDAT